MKYNYLGILPLTPLTSGLNTSLLAILFNKDTIFLYF